MSIETIQAIIKMDNGNLDINKCSSEEHFRISLICRFGTLRANCNHINDGIDKVCKMYQTLEVGDVSVTTVPF